MAAKKAAKGGRPSDYSEASAEAICGRIATSSDGLRKICAELGLEPRTVYRWIATREEFCQRYARAKEFQCEALFDRIQEVAEDATEATVRSSALRVDALKWRLTKLMPKRYGDKVDHDLSGGLELKIIRE